VSALFALLLAQGPASAAPLLCQADLPPSGRPAAAWYNLMVDRDYRPLREELWVRGRGWEAVWRVPRARNSRPTLDIEYEPPTRSMSGATLFAGDRTLLTQRRSVPSSARWRFRVEGTDALTRGPFRIQFRGGGSTVDVAVPLPATAWLDAQLLRAAPVVERQRRARRCRASIVY
jgi:hypothetical protein